MSTTAPYTLRTNILGIQRLEVKMEISLQEIVCHFVFIFVIFDPKNIYLDVLHHVLSRLKYLAPRGWSLKWRSASKRFLSISVFIFVILDPKNLYFDKLHHVLNLQDYHTRVSTKNGGFSQK
jgi:hypothetical protein